MLLQSTINESLPLAQLYANQEIELGAKEGTVLDQLNLVLKKPLSIIAQSGNDEADFTQALKDASRYHDSHENYPHDEIMHSAVQAVSKTLEYNIRLAREVINPQVAELVDGLNNIYNEVAEIKVIPIDSSAANPTLESGIVEEISERFAETKYEDIKLNIKIPRPDDISAYLMTGNPLYDAGIRGTIEALGIDRINQLWDNLFVQGPGKLEEIFDINSANDQALMTIGYVMVSQVKANLPPGINAPLDAITDHLINLQSQLGRLINISFRRRIVNQKLGLVIVDSKHDEILVNPDTYNTYKENGGSDEAIIGASMSGESLTTAIEITENKDRLERIYAARMRAQQETTMTNAITAATTYLHQSLNKIAKDIPADVLASVYDNDYNAIRQQIEKAINTVNANLFHDSWCETRRILCQGVYAHTNALNILKAIDREQAALPEGEILEVALYAIVEHLAQWLSSQMSKSVQS